MKAEDVRYGVLLTAVAVMVIVALMFMRPVVSHVFENLGADLQTTTDQSPEQAPRPR